MAVVVIFIGLGRAPLEPFDDASYADVAKNIVKSGNWLDFYWLGGQPFLEKPPLYYWLTALFFNIFGVNEFGARLFPALSGVGTLAVVFVFARRYLLAESALVSVILLMTVSGFWDFSSRAMLDMPTTFFVTLSLLFFYLSLQQPKAPWYLLYGASFSLAILTKSVVGFIPILVTVIFLALTNARGLLSLKYWAGTLFGLVLASIWHIFAYFRYGEIFIREYFGYHVIQRIAGDIGIHQQPFMYFVNYLYDSERFILFCFAVALPYLLYQAIRSRSQIHILLLVWIAVVFFAISFSRAKLFWYVIPLYPPLAMAIGLAGDSLRKARWVFSWPYKIVIAFTLFWAAHTVFHFFIDKENRALGTYMPSQIRSLLKEVKANSKPDEIVFIYQIGIAVHLTNFYADRKVCFLFDSDPFALSVQQKIPSNYVAKGIVRPISGSDELTKMIAGSSGMFILEKQLYAQIQKRVRCRTVAETNDLIVVRGMGWTCYVKF